MKKELKVWAMTCIAFWWLAPNQLKSQDSLSFQKLDEVVVTASKFPKSYRQTSKVVVIIDSTELRNARGKDLSQVLAAQAGIYVNGANSNPGKDKSVYLRGAASHHTLLLIDGIPVSDPSGVNGVADLRMVPPGEISRIEILKGSQSTLYGSDAMAGVINIITKEGDQASYADVNGSFGSYQSFNGRVSGRVRLGDRTGIRASFGRISTDGFSEAKDTLNSGSFDDDSFRKTSFTLQAELDPAANWQLRPFIAWSDLSGEYDSGPFTDDPEAVFEGIMKRAGLRAGHQYGIHKFSLLTAWTENDRNFTNAFGAFSATGRLLHSEFIWESVILPGLELTGGFAYQRMTIDTDSIPGNSLASPYVNLSFRKGKGGIDGGVRYNHHNVYGSNWTFSINPYLQVGKFRLFANAGTGFKAPTITQLFGQFGPNPDLQPEESLSMETGIHYLSRNFDVRVTAFRRNIRNMIIYTARYENVDEQLVRGVEIEPSWEPSDKFRLSGYYAYMHGEVTTITAEGDSTYQDLIRKPAHSFGLNLFVQPLKNLSMTVQYRAFGRRTDRFFNMTTFLTEEVTLDPYDLLEIYAEYKVLENISVFVNAMNMLNEDYEEVHGYSVRGRSFMLGANMRF